MSTPPQEDKLYLDKISSFLSSPVFTKKLEEKLAALNETFYIMMLTKFEEDGTRHYTAKGYCRLGPKVMKIEVCYHPHSRRVDVEIGKIRIKFDANEVVE